LISNRGTDFLIFSPSPFGRGQGRGIVCAKLYTLPYTPPKGRGRNRDKPKVVDILT
jgi:hypothetical protein